MKKVFLYLIIIFCLFLTSCKNDETEKHVLSKKQIIEKIEKDNTSAKKLVKGVYFASEKIDVNGVEMSVKDEEIKLGDYKNSIQGQNNKVITGYYDEAGLTYYLYRLATNPQGENTIYEFACSKEDKFENVGWVDMLIQNPEDLIMVELNNISENNNDNYQKYAIYTIINKELVKIR